MKQLNVMIKPASSLCNLRCRYCFYADISNIREIPSFGVMKEEVTDAMLENIRKDLEPGDRITFAFQGGEPTLAGLPWFRHFTEITNTWKPDIEVSLALQTNATLLDEDWCRYLHEQDYLVGVSMDILQENHDGTRVDEKGSGTYKQVIRAMKLLDEYRVEYNVLCTLTSQVARHPQQVWKQVKALNIRYVQFTPCLDELDAEKTSVFALKPERFASFYTTLFRLWYEDVKKGEYRSVKLFDDLIGYLATGVPSTCDVAGHCSPQFVVEADGSVYPCDFYCLDEYRIGDITKDGLLTLGKSAAMAAFLNRGHRGPKLCADCRYGNFCGGGCKRMQKQVCCGPEDDFCGNRSFLDSCIKELLMLAEQEKRYNRGF
ncbi:MAG: SPASM domain-containing protein [Lachnospiraceae bacterium]|nr:SPASM domain-containing protein [Lachnospiraceae bacterium]